MTSGFETSKQIPITITTLDEAPFESTTTPSRIPRILAIEEKTFSAITVVPIIAYAEAEAGPSYQEPVLGRTENQPWFSPLITMFCIWAMFITFFVFFFDYVWIWIRLCPYRREDSSCSGIKTSPVVNALEVMMYAPPVTLFCAVLLISLWPGRKYLGFLKWALWVWKVVLWLACVSGPMAMYLALVKALLWSNGWVFSY